MKKKPKPTTGERIAEDYHMYTGNRTREQACADPWLVNRIDRAIAALEEAVKVLADAVPQMPPWAEVNGGADIGRLNYTTGVTFIDLKQAHTNPIARAALDAARKVNP